ncbi:hypothetical protein CC80DRAFT_150418 [Byssothecium circinans]|uniref:Uncharacterized protein n=1 Tax=Byssothecium circinans TaxID=147558 RepID=A0A6A5TJV9_9PLEO|nr:hypothetical protein CC80DRAFT_150418 [Byssothecium circinans]
MGKELWWRRLSGVRKRGQQWRKVAIGASLRCYLCPNHFTFNHALSLQRQILEQKPHPHGGCSKTRNRDSVRIPLTDTRTEFKVLYRHSLHSKTDFSTPSTQLDLQFPLACRLYFHISLHLHSCAPNFQEFHVSTREWRSPSISSEPHNRLTNRRSIARLLLQTRLFLFPVSR